MTIRVLARVACFPLLVIFTISLLACSSKPKENPTPNLNPTPPPEVTNSGENHYLFPGQQALTVMTNKADYVVEGVTGRIWSRYEVDELGNKLIFSYVTINLINQQKGEELPDTITVKNPGGQVGDRQMIVTHVPQYWHEGQHVFLFLNRRIGYLWTRQGEPSKIVVNLDEQAEFQDQTVPADAIRALVVQ